MSQGRRGLAPGKAGIADPRVTPLPSLQGKEEFEKTQKELLEKGNIIRQSKDQLEHQQVTELWWAAAVWILLPSYTLPPIWTMVSSCVAVPMVGSGSPLMPAERDAGALLLERSLAQLS